MSQFCTRGLVDVDPLSQEEPDRVRCGAEGTERGSSYTPSIVASCLGCSCGPARRTSANSASSLIASSGNSGAWPGAVTAEQLAMLLCTLSPAAGERRELTRTTYLELKSSDRPDTSSSRTDTRTSASPPSTVVASIT